MNQATYQFIVDKSDQDVKQLALQASRYPLVDMPFAVRQIAGRQKIRTKIPGFYACETIHYPIQLSLEQSSSESTALYKSSLCEGNTLTDLTGGFGIDCYFMSSRFKKVRYVEQNLELCELAKHNFNALNAHHIEVIHTDSVDYLQQMPAVDWIYIDPARRSKSGQKVVLISDCTPNVAELCPLLLAKCQHLMVKLSPMMDIKAAIKALPNTAELHIISIENECKEILLLIHSKKPIQLIIKTINFSKNKPTQSFEFEDMLEEKQTADIATEIGTYLYEPNAAIMKSGAFKLIGNKFELAKLHTNTHLYTSDELKSEFPGRIFRVDKLWKDGKEEWKKEAEILKKGNLSTRNYPSSVDEMRKKLKLSDGGDTYLFACTLDREKKVMISCSKIN